MSEIWKDIDWIAGFEGRYQISSEGRVKSNPSNNTLDNIEWVSMRENVTHGLNRSNSRKKSSRYPGVHYNSSNTDKVWRAVVFVNGHSKFIGNFSSEEEAHGAYLAALAKYSVSNKYAEL